MKAITVKQPWASLMFIDNGYEPKNIENRTWKTKIRGRILIHAGATIIRPQQCVFTDDQWDNIRGDMRYKILHGDLPSGAIIGSVEIVDCVINHPSIWAEKSETNCSEKCRLKNCEHFIEWGFRSNNDCRSCKLIGQSYEIDEVPKDCPHNMKIPPIYNLVLANPIKLDTPIPCKGKLSFWEFDETLIK